MSETAAAIDSDSIKSIHRDFDGSALGWNGITWLIELDGRVQVNVQGNPVMVDYFVASNVVKDEHQQQQTIVFPTNDLYRPLKHKGVVGSKGWTLKKAMIAFREWLDERPDVRAMQEVTL